MLEDVYRCVRDMKLFRVRALSLSEALKAHNTDGAAAVGYEALSADFYQIGKVLNNYLARVNKTIEDIPGADPEAAVEISEAAEAVEVTKRADREPPEIISEFYKPNETYEHTNERLLPIYREAQHMKERAIDANDRADRLRWELKARKLDLTMFWMHGRMIETV